MRFRWGRGGALGVGCLAVVGALVLWNMTGPFWGTSGGMFRDTVPVGGSVVVETMLVTGSAPHFLAPFPPGVVMRGWFRLGTQLAYRVRVTKPGVVPLPGLWFLYRTDGIPRLGWYPSGTTVVHVLGRFPWSRDAAPPIRYPGRRWAYRQLRRIPGGPPATAWLVDSTVGQVHAVLGPAWFPGADPSALVSVIAAAYPFRPWSVIAQDLETRRTMRGLEPVARLSSRLATLGEVVAVWGRPSSR